VTAARLTTVPLEGEVAAVLATVPAVAGVGQILGPESRNLLIGKPANLRRWAASRLGVGKPPKKGARPPTDLRPIATAIAYQTTTSPFHQRLAFERVMARHVPSSARRDLKSPSYLHLDARERFPRITIRSAESGLHGLYGPFRDRRTAESARQHLHKRFPLRPCDYSFEPDPALPLGLGCLYAQVRSCAAPCLARVSEEEYRASAAQAATYLAGPEAREEGAEALLRPWVAAAEPGTALVVERGRSGLEVYPVRRGAVLEEGSVVVAAGEPLESALARVRWPDVGSERDDGPWISSWLNGPRRRAAYVLVDANEEPAGWAACIRSAGVGWAW
jgi:hypothetical protein